MVIVCALVCLATGSLVTACDSAAGGRTWQARRQLLTSRVLQLVNIPRKKIITTGPFAFMKHPLYTSMALLVLPGVGLVLDTWVGFAIGAVLYIASRIFSGGEDQFLEQLFTEAYLTYRSRVLLPWL